ncbi:soluble scavenger receptor cysteine-rich domain-containing protein SSC5D-like [Halichondria panicea]|uniref:soluble scavenger receptor cysteine-rich domain-containing protein SSC5D-like n=1 Tax=Halichondria panicea TaxID=6063 RepID=UPI00312BBB70
MAMMNCLLWKSITFLSLVWAVGGQLSGDLRLVDSFGLTGGSSGRLEVYYSGKWGTVCDDSFGIDDARVACRQLGFSTSSTPRYGTVGTLGFSEASLATPTWLDNLACYGYESRLIDCPANSIGVEDCPHYEDIALICTESTANGDLRLVGSSGQTGGSSGRLEFYYSGQWGTVCDDSFGIDDARVACRQLGFSTYTQYGNVGTLGFSEASSATRTWLDELRCYGYESRLIDCPANTIGVEDCPHYEDIALICTESTASGDLRLVGSSGRTGGSSGRLEFYYSGQWGTVCDDSFGIDDARVACRQLGFSTYTRYGNVGTLGFSEASSTTSTWLDNLACYGYESRLIDCPANTIGVEDCSHYEDIALVCTTSSTTTSSYSVPSFSIGFGVTIPIIVIIVVIFVLVCVLMNRRRRLARYPRYAPIITAANTQDAAFPVQQPMDPTPPYSPPQNMQPVTAYPTGQYADPQYPTSYPQQPPAPYPTSYPQQPPAPYPPGQQPPAAYTQQPPAPHPPGEQPPAAYTQQPLSAPHPPGEQPPPARYPTGQPPSAPLLYGGEAPPAYPN